MRKGFVKGLGRQGRQGCLGGGQGAWNGRGRCHWPADDEGLRSTIMDVTPRLDTFNATSILNVTPSKDAPSSSLRKGYTVAISTEVCIGCGVCVGACRLGAISLEHGKAVINEALCRPCAACVRVCPVSAIQKVHEP